MDLGLAGKRAIVLSSSRGLGRGIAEALAAEGAHVLMTARSGDRLKEAADAIGNRLKEAADATGKKGPGRASTLVGDLKDNVEAIHAAAMKELGGVDILVANTGGPPARTPLTVQPDEWVP